MSGINYVVETSAAKITGEIAPFLHPLLKGRERLWIRVHERGDEVHSATAKRLIMEGIRQAPVEEGFDLWYKSRHVIAQTYELFEAALDEAYSN